MTPFVDNYDSLVEMFEDNGLGRNKDYYVWNYDWRKPVEEIVDDFDNFVSLKVGDTAEVNVVGHSLGGLVARTWLQENVDKENISKVISLGAPQNGSVKAYEIWNGKSGELDMSSVAIGILSRIQSKQSISRIETTRSYSPSLKDLMPVFDFVKYEGQIVPWETMTDRNTSLESINQNIPNIWSKYFGIVGSGFDTKSFVLVRQANVYEKVLGLWADGAPNGYEYAVGDKTVLKSSAILGNDEYVEIQSDHGDIVNNSLNEIASILGLANTGPSAASSLENKIIYFIGSPAYLEVDCGGDSKTSNEEGFVIFDRDDYSSCVVNIVGTGEGEYHFVGGRTKNIEEWEYYQGNIGVGETKTMEINLEKNLEYIGDGGEYLRNLILDDLNTLGGMFVGDSNVGEAIGFVADNNIEDAIVLVFNIRRAYGENDISSRLIRNLTLLSGVDNGSEAEIGDYEIEVENLATTVDLIKNLKISSGIDPGVFGATSFLNYEEYWNNSVKSLSDGEYNKAKAELVAAERYLYEVW